MSETLDLIRKKYPQYNDMDDDELTLKVGSKYPVYLGQDKQFKQHFESLGKVEQGSLLGMGKPELQAKAEQLRSEGTRGGIWDKALNAAMWATYLIPGRAAAQQTLQMPQAPVQEPPQIIDPQKVGQSIDPMLQAWGMSGSPVPEAIKGTTSELVGAAVDPNALAVPHLYIADMIRRSPEAVNNVLEAAKTGDPHTLAKSITDATAQLSLPVLGGYHVGKAQMPVEPSRQAGMLPQEAARLAPNVGPREIALAQAREAIDPTIMSPSMEAEAKLDLALKLGEERVRKDQHKSTRDLKEGIEGREQRLKVNEQSKEQSAMLAAQERAIATGQLSDVGKPSLDTELINEALAQSGGMIRPNVSRAEALRRVGELTGVRQQQPIVPANQPAGEPKQGGQISFASPATAEAIPNARQAAVPGTAEAGFKAGQGAEQPPDLLQSVASVVNNKDRTGLQEMRDKISAGNDPQTGQPKVDPQTGKPFEQAPGIGTRSQPNDMLRLIDARLAELNSGIINPELEAIRRIQQGRPSRGQPITPTVITSEPGAVNRGRLLGPGGEDLPPTDKGTGPSPAPPTTPKEGPTAPGAAPGERKFPPTNTDTQSPPPSTDPRGLAIQSITGYKFNESFGKWHFTDPATGMTVEGIEPGTSVERVRARMEEKILEDKKAREGAATELPEGQPTTEPKKLGFSDYSKQFLDHIKSFKEQPNKPLALYDFIMKKLVRDEGMKPTRAKGMLQSSFSWKQDSKSLKDQAFVDWVNRVAGGWTEGRLSDKVVTEDRLAKLANEEAADRGATELPTKETLPDAMEGIAQKVATDSKAELTQKELGMMYAFRKGNPEGWQRYKDRIAEIRKTNRAEAKKATKREAYKASIQPAPAKLGEPTGPTEVSFNLLLNRAAALLKAGKITGADMGQLQKALLEVYRNKDLGAYTQLATRVAELEGGHNPSVGLPKPNEINPGRPTGKGGFQRKPRSSEEGALGLGPIEELANKAAREVELITTGVRNWWDKGYRAMKYDVIPTLWDKSINLSRDDARKAINNVKDRVKDIWGHEVNDTIAKALSFAAEAGDRTTLQAMRRRLMAYTSNEFWVKEARKSTLEALQNWDKYERLVPSYREMLDSQQTKESSLGVPVKHRRNYVPHAQDVRGDDYILGDAGHSMGTAFMKERFYDTFVDSILNDVKPYTLDAFKLAEHRMIVGNKRVYFQAMVDTLRDTTDPVSGGPILMGLPSGSSSPIGYHAGTVGGFPVLVRDGYEGIFDDLQRASWFERNPAGRAIQELASFNKHTVLGFDLYHPNRLLMWAAPLRGSLSYDVRKGLHLLEYDDATLKRMVNRGEIPRSELDNLQRKRYVSNIALRTGFNVSEIGETLYTNWLREIPGLGDYNRLVFDVFQRGLMMETYLHEFERLKKQNPTMGDEAVGRMTSKNLNTRFGTFQNQSWIKSKTFMDLMNLMFLSPRWNEGLLRSELATYKDVGKSIYDSLAQKRLVAGTFAKDVGIITAAYFAVNQAINFATRGQPTWKNDDDVPGAKISAWIPGGDNGFFLNPMALTMEISHTISQRAFKQRSTTEALNDLKEGKLAPLGRMADVFYKQEDWRRNHLKDWDLIKEAFKEGAPEPMQWELVKDTMGAAKDKLLYGKDFSKGVKEREPYPGAVEQRLLPQIGLKADRIVLSPGERINKEAISRFGTSRPTLEQRGIISESIKKETPPAADLAAKEASARRATEGEFEARKRITSGLSSDNQKYLTDNKLFVPSQKEDLRINKKDVRLNDAEADYYESMMIKAYDKYFTAISKQKEFNKLSAYDKQKIINADLAKKRREIRIDLRNAIESHKVPEKKKRFSIFQP